MLVGLTGIGGGSLMTPLLLLVGGYSPVVAIGTDLAYGAVTKTVGGWRHLRAGHVDLRLSWWLAAGSVPGSIVGVVTLSRLREHLRRGLRALPARRSSRPRSCWPPGRRSTARCSAPTCTARAGLGRAEAAPQQGRDGASSALVLGFILGMTSVGSGALVGLVLILLYRLRPRRVVGTDVFHAAVLLWSAGLAHLGSGNVDLALMATILVGSLPGVWIGTALMPTCRSAGLRHALGDRARRRSARRARQGRRADVAGRAGRDPLALAVLSVGRAPAADAARGRWA